MITVDPREGTSMEHLLRQRGLPVEPSHLEYGDYSWLGNGPEGMMTVPCGVERKRLDPGSQDLLNCIMDDRFNAHQLIGLKAAYSRVYLLVEGRFHSDKAGNLCFFGNPVERRGKKDKGSYWTYSAVVHWLQSREEEGVAIRYSDNPADSARQIGLLYSWWTGKEWNEHHWSSKAVHENGNGRVSLAPSATKRPSVLQKWANALDGLGPEFVRAALARWKTPLEMALAGEEEWAELKTLGYEGSDKRTRKLGGSKAGEIVKSIRGQG